MEQEIKKHTSKIISAVRHKDKSLKKRIAEIFIEVMIIIFAVTFAAYIERSREYHHEQKEVKEFLQGLKTDLTNDVKEMESDKRGYTVMKSGFNYFISNEQFNKDSLKAYYGVFWSYVNLLVNDGRYEGFKSSGKINTIENVELRNAILDLYQETLVGLLSTTQKYTTLKYDFRKVLYVHLRRNNIHEPNLEHVLKVPEITNYCYILRSSTTEAIWRYDSTIAQSKRIISLIDKEYGHE